VSNNVVRAVDQFAVVLRDDHMVFGHIVVHSADARRGLLADDDPALCVISHAVCDIGVLTHQLKARFFAPSPGLLRFQGAEGQLLLLCAPNQASTKAPISPMNCIS
jgi:hypothetical protein